MGAAAWSVAVVVGLLGACAPAEQLLDGDPFSDADAKADDAARLVNHGPAYLGLPMTIDTSPTASFHYAHFELGGPAVVSLLASVPSNQLVPHVYLCKLGADGRWPIVAGNLVELEAELEPGSYRIFSFPNWNEATGRYTIATTCTGTGCPTQQCLFGARWNDFVEAEAPPVPVSVPELYDPSAASAWVHERALVNAAAALGLPAVSPVELLALVDDQAIELRVVRNTTGARLTVATFRVGGVRMGAALGTLDEIRAKIVDDVVSDCNVGPGYR
jgi:hypothetical protein